MGTPRSLLFLLLISTALPGSKVRVTATSVTMSVETSFFYGKEVETRVAE